MDYQEIANPQVEVTRANAMLVSTIRTGMAYENEDGTGEAAFLLEFTGPLQGSGVTVTREAMFDATAIRSLIRMLQSELRREGYAEG